jgi:endogenous inhibitor of DNA gyrase (YacG/DUF329 family)
MSGNAPPTGRTCPTCGKAVTAADSTQSPSFPFCSPRCKLIDLGRWLSGDYRIPSRPASSDDDTPPEEPPLRRGR